MPAAIESRHRTLGGQMVAAAVAGTVFWIAWDNGSYGLSSRAALAIAVFWGIAIAVGVGFTAPARVPRATVVVGALFAALAGLTLASTAWAASAEDAVGEFNRVSLYLGVYVLAVTLAGCPARLERWAEGLALGIVVLAIVALLGRLFPGSLPDRDISTFLPAAATRLSVPVGYWNGLAVIVALGVPLLLRIALTARSAAVRGLALAPLPAMAATVYLTSSRGGIATAVAATVVFVALSEERWKVIGALTVASGGGAAAVTALLSREELVDGRLDSTLARDQGRSAAVLIAIACVATAGAYAAGAFAAGRLATRLRPGPALRRLGLVTALAAVVVGLVVAVVASDPMARFEAFKEPPANAALPPSRDSTRAHLLSGSGSARWQFWSAAADQWREHPWVGDGAGSFESWWAEHAAVARFVRDAHSLYLETLGELGVAGFLLVAALISTGIAVGVRRSLLAVGRLRATTAAATAVFSAYAFAAAFDWMWEVTAVSVVAVAALALATAPAASPDAAGADDAAGTASGSGVRVVAVSAALLLLGAQVPPLLAERGVARSQEAVRAGDLRKAAEAAEAARNFAPWAAAPHLQLALVAEEGGDVRRALHWLGEALERDERDWRLWLVSGRLELKLGRVAAAGRSIDRAVALNPRSPLLERLRVSGGGA